VELMGLDRNIYPLKPSVYVSRTGNVKIGNTEMS
jgi:hypothetical protein